MNQINNDVYVVMFIDTIHNKNIFLADAEDIDEICYEKDPKLLGTTDITKAKFYKSLDKAKDDIYKLRYHHRKFLKISTRICKVNLNNLYSKLSQQTEKIKGE